MGMPIKNRATIKRVVQKDMEYAFIAKMDFNRRRIISASDGFRSTVYDTPFKAEEAFNGNYRQIYMRISYQVKAACRIGDIFIDRCMWRC
jgi:hypothetical protein